MKFTTKEVKGKYDTILGIDLDDCENSILNPSDDQLFDILVVTVGHNKYEVAYRNGKITRTLFR